MENNNNGGTVQASSDLQNDWQQAEKRQIESREEEDTLFDLRSAQANGYGTENNLYDAEKEDVEEGDDLDEDEDDLDDEDYDDDMDDDDIDEDDLDNDDEDEPTVSDWGDVDPQNNGFPSSNDPAAPGSAV
jgi:hypothetical protein